MKDYINYIKCGEILKSPSISYKDQYVLKCIECDESFLLLESFIGHSVSHSTSVYGLLDEIIKKDILDQESSDVIAIEHVAVKYEDIADADELDPLMAIKNKLDPICDDIKTEKKSQKLEQKTSKVEEVIVDRSLNTEQFSDSDDAYGENSGSDTDNESVESEQVKSPNIIHNFMKTEKDVTCFIAAYKSQTFLWNASLAEFKDKKLHQKCLEKIRNELKEQNIHITCKQVLSIVRHLCRKYKSYLYSCSNDGNDEKLKKDSLPECIIKQLEFLKPFVKNKSKAKLDNHPAELEPEQFIKILAIYERFPNLWNTNLIENCCKNKRLESLEQMLDIVNAEMGLKITQNTLKKYTHFIHARLTKEKQNRISSSAAKSKKTYEYSQYMMFLYDHVGPFKCLECGSVLKNPLKFKVHKAQHDGSVPLACYLCNKDFKAAGSYISHAKRHMEDLQAVCGTCGKSFLSPCDLKIHMRCHTGVKPYFCEVCGVSFRHIQTFTTHKRRHEKKFLHSCPICSKGFYRKTMLDDHLRSHAQIRNFACSTCGKAFKTNKTLKQHLVIHEDIWRHSCALCGKAFKLKVGLLQHMRTH